MPLSMHVWLTARLTRFSAISPSACREDTAAKYRLGPLSFFSGLHVLAQDGVNRTLVPAAVFAEKRQNVGIDPQSNLLFGSRPDNRVCKKVWPQLWNIGKVDVLIPEGVNPLPVRSGSPFRILRALHNVPFLTK